MKGLVAVLLSLVLAGLAAWYFYAASDSTAPAEMTGADAIQELTPIFEAYTAGMVGGDAQAVTSLYTSDAVEMVPGPIRPHDVIVDHYNEVIDAGTFLAFDFTPMDAWVQGDAAFSISEVDISYQVGGDPTMTFEYYSFMRFEKVDGEWRIDRNLAGPRNPPPEG
jgi:ketosteroid isomerase-like protein